MHYLTGVFSCYNLDQFRTIYAYGDTSDDEQMLDLADVKYYSWKWVQLDKSLVAKENIIK